MRSSLSSLVGEIVASIFREKGPKLVLEFFDLIQPILMEYLSAKGFSVSLEDFSIPLAITQHIHRDIDDMSNLLMDIRTVDSESLEIQLQNRLKALKILVSKSILKLSALGDLIDTKSDSATLKVVQQVGFLGPQLSSKGKFYTSALVEEIEVFFQAMYPYVTDYPAARYGLLKNCFFHGLDPYEELVHSVASREVMVRSSRGLAEPGTLFKNLMAILRDVVICYDGTVRNVCSKFIIQFNYAVKSEAKNLYQAGEPVGVLAATAMSNPAYKAVLDSSPSSNFSWELMKEILLCKVNFKNDSNDRRAILLLNECDCGRTNCQERAAYMVQNHLKKISLKDAAVEFMIEYVSNSTMTNNSHTGIVLNGHIHLNKELMNKSNVSMQGVLQKCQETVNAFRKKKKVDHVFKCTSLSISECCSCEGKWSGLPCLTFWLHDASDCHLEKTSQILADVICPVLLETIVKGDPGIYSANIIWISPDTATWIRNPSKNLHGELALDVVLEKSSVKQSGDAWRILLDSCLPVLHLIDTRRSVPYAIKQVQELLGISCAFQQAVQRLSRSVTMVTKGVLKEHLVLLANSMACSGNLIGFTVGGYKALTQSLNIQVPFTEGTLYTPRRCFERAAEKCHSDTLSSIVASCSWGKNVAVGTGAPFEILLNTDEMGMSQGHEGGTDVYSFLHMVSSANGDHLLETDCLGADLEYMSDDKDIAMSPEHDTGSMKPTFDDSDRFENLAADNESGSAWDSVSPKTVGPDKDAGWSGGKTQSQNDVSLLSKANAWSSWGSDKDEVLLEQPSSWGQHIEANISSSWGKKVAVTEPKSSSWGKKAAAIQIPEQPCGTANEVATGVESDGWGGKATETKSNWGQAIESVGKKESDRNVGEQTWVKKDHETKEAALDKSSWQAWGKKTTGESDKNIGEQTWGQKVQETEEAAPEKRSWQTWGRKTTGESDENVGEQTWGQKVHETKEAAPDKSSWQTWRNKTTEESDKNAGEQTWGKKVHETKEVAPDKSSWQTWRNKTTEDSDKNAGVRTWGQKVHETEEAAPDKSSWQTWGKKTTELQSEGQDATSGDVSSNTGRWSSWGKKVDEPEEAQRKESEGTHSCSNQWNSPRPKTNNETEVIQWGQRTGGKRNRQENMSGPSNRLPKPVDRFTLEEQEILSVVEPMAHTITRILHHSGYNEGDRLSADDEAYLLNQVFNYHPNKAEKMGAGVDHVVVNKHSTHQNSKCFYIIQTDGHPEDFSTRKCIMNIITEKFPEKADGFIKKYYPRQANRERDAGGEMVASNAAETPHVDTPGADNSSVADTPQAE